MWLNENAGIVVLVFGVLTLALLVTVLWLVFTLRNRFAVQRLKFVGLYATDVDDRTDYASLTIGNRSVSEIALKELGVKNGRIAFNLTALYRKKEGLDKKTHIVIEQRRSIGFRLEREELLALLVDGKRGKVLRALRLYAIDLTGNVYEGRIPAVRKLLAQLLAGAPAKEPAPSAVPAVPLRRPAAPVREPDVSPAPAKESDHPAEGAELAAAHAGTMPYEGEEKTEE